MECAREALCYFFNYKANVEVFYDVTNIEKLKYQTF